jgi:hypothetical protein
VRLIRVLAIAGAGLLVLATPTVSLADICGGIATVAPSSGPAGTTFLFRTNQGAATNVYVYHDGKLVRTDRLVVDGFVSYRIRTDNGDEGGWRVRAAVQGHQQCYGEARFHVTGVPDTSTVENGGSRWPVALAILVGAFAFVCTFRRSRVRHAWTGE